MEKKLNEKTPWWSPEFWVAHYKKITYFQAQVKREKQKANSKVVAVIPISFTVEIPLAALMSYQWTEIDTLSRQLQHETAPAIVRGLAEQHPEFIPDVRRIQVLSKQVHEMWTSDWESPQCNVLVYTKTSLYNLERLRKIVEEHDELKAKWVVSEGLRSYAEDIVRKLGDTF